MQANDFKEEKDQRSQLADEYRRMMATEGWKGMQAKYITDVQNFVTNILTSEDSIDKFNTQCLEIRGVRKFLSHVTELVETIDRERKDAEPKPTE